MAHYFTNDDTEHDFREIEYEHAGKNTVSPPTAGYFRVSASILGRGC